MTNREKLLSVKKSLVEALDIVSELLSQNPSAEEQRFPTDPVAKTLADMVTTKQLGMIRAVAREAAIDADEECRQILNCRISELSRRAASAFIDHLRELKPRDLPPRRVI